MNWKAAWTEPRTTGGTATMCLAIHLALVLGTAVTMRVEQHSWTG